MVSALKKDLVKPFVAYSSFTYNHMIITRSEMFSVMVHILYLLLILFQTIYMYMCVVNYIIFRLTELYETSVVVKDRMRRITGGHRSWSKAGGQAIQEEVLLRLQMGVMFLVLWLWTGVSYQTISLFSSPPSAISVSLHPSSTNAGCLWLHMYLLCCFSSTFWWELLLHLVCFIIMSTHQFFQCWFLACKKCFDAWMQAIYKEMWAFSLVWWAAPQWLFLLLVSQTHSTSGLINHSSIKCEQYWKSRLLALLRST